MKFSDLKLLSLMAMFVSTLASAQINVENPWVRATVPGQQATGAFMKISSTEAVKLVSVASAVAKVNEIHEMKMEGAVMKMRAHQGGLDIPPNKVIELKSGGYHVMMMDLKQTIHAGDLITLELQFTGEKGQKKMVSVNAKASLKDPYQ